MISAIVWDMDGTIADLYGVIDWLPKLRSSDPSPYIDAEPLYNMQVLSSLVSKLSDKGITQIICTWLAKEASKSYKKKTKVARKNGCTNIILMQIKSTWYSMEQTKVK